MLLKFKEAVETLKKFSSDAKDKAASLEKEESDLSEEELKKQEAEARKRKIKRLMWIALAQMSMLAAQVILPFLAGMMIFFLIFLCIIAIISAVTGLISTMTKQPDIPIGASQVAGERYVWNEADLSKLSSEYLKNIYRQAWLIENSKEVTKCQFYTTAFLGINTVENGTNFFSSAGLKLNDGTDAETLSIADYASGMTSLSNITYQGIYQQFTHYTDKDSGVTTTFSKYFQDYLTKYGIEYDYIWGNMKHTNPLQTSYNGASIIGAERQNIIDTYGSGNVMTSNYNIAALIFSAVSAAEGKSNMLDKEFKNGHGYQDGYKKALEHYELSDDTEVRRYVQSALFYHVHAGGVWNYFSDDSYAQWKDAALDYLVYMYKYHRDLAFSDKYVNVDTLRKMDASYARIPCMGDNNHNWASELYTGYVSKDKASDGRMVTGGKTVTTSMVGEWEKYLEAEGKYTNYITVLNTLLSYGSGKNPVRQGAYSVLTSPGIISMGDLKLKVIADELGLDLIVDPNTGFVCNAVTAGGASGAGYGVIDGHFDPHGQFENSKIMVQQGGKTFYLSNIRNPDWFVSLNNSEWCSPLSTDGPLGGIYITSRYGYRSYNNWDFHQGIDCRHATRTTSVEDCKKYAPVYAMHDGEITYNGVCDGGGNTVTYKVTYSRNGVMVTRYITYMHLSDITAPPVETKVSKGDTLGHMGKSGGNYEIHLHIQLTQNSGPAGRSGAVDIETELPFITNWSGYSQWFNTANGYSGYLLRKPNPNVGENGCDTYNYRLGGRDSNHLANMTYTGEPNPK